MKPSVILREIKALKEQNPEKWFALLEQVSDIWFDEFCKRTPDWKAEAQPDAPRS